MSGARTAPFIVALLTVFLLAASSGMAGENCSMLSGSCRDACGENEEAGIGDFMDCGKKQECCIGKDPSRDKVGCCIYSFDARQYGASNCGAPVNNICQKGSESPMACEKLKLCRDRRDRGSR